MAFQTNVLRGGEWVTETIDLQAVLKASAPAKPPRQRSSRPPRCGIITRTVVESPLAHHILPVRLRSAVHSDVAFVGDHFVHIRELRPDGQLQDIIHKNDFGDRIRSAQVIGSVPNGSESTGMRPQVKLEQVDDIDMLDPDGSHSELSWDISDIAPQMLLIVLERGDCIFMVVRTKDDGSFEFVTSQFEMPHIRARYPGFHLAVDPSSRYVALGCFEDTFIVFELESRAVLNDRYRRNVDLRPVKTSRPRLVNGVIHKMEFLFPPRADDYQIIMVLIIVKGQVSRMVVYEWEAGDDLRGVFQSEKRGHRLPQEHQMPVLLIPLMVRTSFFAVYKDRIAVGKDVLVGPPDFQTFHIENPPPSELYSGSTQPLWTAWTRPFRLPQWTNDRDVVYLAREDGVVMFLDIDSDNILGASQILKTLDCNISTAFCSLFDQFADLLVVGGDSGPGAIWQLLPRQDPVKLGVIPNWSRTPDFVTTDEFSRWDSEVGSRESSLIPWSKRQGGVYKAPDRIFAASGRGPTGSITEFRQGLPANIGLYFDCSPTTTNAWLFPVRPGSMGTGYYMLTSMPDKSTVLRLPHDLSEVSEPSSESVPYDLSSRTIAAALARDDMVIQITETCIVCVSLGKSIRTMHQSLSQESQTAVTHAAILQDLVVLSRGTSSRSTIEIFRVGFDTPPAAAVPSVQVDGEVTCLSFATLPGGLRFVFAGLWKDNSPCLARLSLDGLDAGQLDFVPLGLQSTDTEQDQNPDGKEKHIIPVEAFTSIVCLEPADGFATITLGSRNGVVATVTITPGEAKPDVRLEIYGVTAATVSATGFCGRESVFVCCDLVLFLLTDFDPESRMCFRGRHRVWPVDAQDASKPSPPVHSVTVLKDNFTDNPNQLPVLLAAGSQILMAALLSRPQQVPRSIPLLATPLKAIYSHVLECLVVAVESKGCPTLKFIDPDSGRDLGVATDKNGESVPFIAGLGSHGDEILGLSEWVHSKDGKNWYYILASTKQGQLVVISTEKVKRQHLTEADAGFPQHDDAEVAAIRYWTRYRKKGFTDPIYSVMGNSDGVIYCVGTKIEWNVLNIAERKLELKRAFDVRSPVTSFRVINGKIVALTMEDSVVIFNHTGMDSSQEMTLEHADPRARPSTHMIEVAIGVGERDATTVGAASTLLLCDRASGLVGLWVPWQQPGRDCEVIFEAELPAGVQKFRRGHTRPGWLHAQRRPEFGVVPSTIDGADILGICLNGALQHFTFIKLEAWAVLRFVQNLAIASPLIYPFTHERAYDEVTGSAGPGVRDSPPLQHRQRDHPEGDADNVDIEDDEDESGEDGDDGFDPSPVEDASFEMQIDGDMLMRCLEKRCLKDVLAGLAGPRQRRRRQRNVAKLAELLGDLFGGVWSEADEERCFKTVYDIMEYYLAPVF